MFFNGLLNRMLRGIVVFTIATTLFLGTTPLPVIAQVETPPPNILYFQVDNFGFGELGSYGGGILRGTPTERIDRFAEEGIKLLNFAPESQCTPSRSALMTGRYAIRSGTHTISLGGDTGLVAWEKTIGDILSDSGYNNYIAGKWHIGETEGRRPTDHGFLHWYGVPRSYGDSYWFEDPYYAAVLDPNDPYYVPELDRGDVDRGDPITHVIESVPGQPLQEHEILTIDVKRNLDTKYMDLAKQWMQESRDTGKPFFMYFNHTLMHYPVIPRDEFKGQTGYGDFADSLYELDSDFGQLLDYLDELGVANNTIVVFAGDNGADITPDALGNSGFFEGSLFAGSEGNLRTPCILRYPDKVPAGQESDEIVHITDMFTTLVRWAGAEIPQDREIDGLDQRAFFEGKQQHSARDGFPYWNGPTLYGVKWHHYKVKFYDQTNALDPALKLATPYLINLRIDPKESVPFNYPYTWVLAHISRIMADFQASVEREPLIPAGAPLDYDPYNPPKLINFPIPPIQFLPGLED